VKTYVWPPEGDHQMWNRLSTLCSVVRENALLCAAALFECSVAVKKLEALLGIKLLQTFSLLTQIFQIQILISCLLEGKLCRVTAFAVIFSAQPPEGCSENAFKSIAVCVLRCFATDIDLVSELLTCCHIL
jgi:hypothetical protein